MKDDLESAKKYMERPDEGCTFLQTKKEFRMQHWYFCYTCGFTGNSGVCAVCIHTCHKGHQVAYSRKSNFFCDCGDSGRCQSLKPASSKKSEVPKDQDMKDISSRPGTSKRKRKPENIENPHLNPKDGSSMFSGENPFIKREVPANSFLPPREFMIKYGFPPMEEEDEVHMFYRHLDGMMERERIGGPFDKRSHYINPPSILDSDMRASARIA